MSNLTISTEAVLDSLLGTDTTNETVREVQERLSKLCTPWEKDGCTPAGFVRKNGTGQILGIVNARLGGFGWPHSPYKHGWGFEANNPRGSGACLGGIQIVDIGQLVVDAPENKSAVKMCEESAKEVAMKLVDDFLVSEFRLHLLERVL